MYNIYPHKCKKSYVLNLSLDTSTIEQDTNATKSSVSAIFDSYGRPFQINSALIVVEVDGGDGVHHDGEQDTNWQSPHFWEPRMKNGLRALQSMEKQPPVVLSIFLFSHVEHFPPEMFPDQIPSFLAASSHSPFS